MNKLIALAFALSLVACTESADVPNGPVSPDPSPAIAVEKMGEPDECGIVPDSELCAIACDQQALLEAYVQPGTCAVYECHLADGSPINVGGCRR